ncbi:PVC-type heme-binding CxxCH protein [Prosthecobacter vanneervenii]|uniref:Putative membrane-bound dehydrogenase-like protein n=1 Tax=Prosthecobacter vanneervenii TaxID=48466 RepID=A0A7W8DI87_9BACT|nr:PVC-type heme-binding CxxCH protein [Prosthecobacter vanneervenii]MBB5030680.1 putative membrane-bound dehydrogenase-like protein [Prosthecobacter vanneervenii]
MIQTAACSLTLLLAFSSSLFAQADGIKTKTTYAKAYGETKNAVAVDPAKDLPRYPAVEPKDAIGTWQVKKGFKLQLAANEPQVRSPIAVCFDENGRMFVCEMIDYSEMRDVTPHLGRISMLEDKDGDGHFETSTVFADDLPWPTGLVWANGGLFVGATPDIWRFEDTDGDGRAEVREKVFTGFGTGLKILNVQGLMNSFQWGQDNRIHILAGGGNRGVITCLKRSNDKGIELGGKDFWFDPLTLEFGLEGGGAQYGMSFDNYGRKFGCSNSDHLQYWVYDDKYANRNPYYAMPPAKQSIAVDGGAAEVFRISPDEPWRIIRTRWRIAGVVKGAVEGGGRVSGYFTGATGTTIYRGDAYGPDFVNNSFTGDAGGQLVHRKLIKPSADGISLIGERPADEHGFEFAASKDTWVRVVNFANAPDGCLHICDMYREVIEHPWSIPDEIKKHIDLNSGNDRGRIYRIVPEGGAERIGQKVALGKASTEELVKTLGHPNGWHRDTAQRLLYERKDKAAVPLLEKVLSGDNALAKLHALGALAGLGVLSEDHILTALKDGSSAVTERACILAESLVFKKAKSADDIVPLMLKLTGKETAARTRYQALLSLGSVGHQNYGTKPDALDASIETSFAETMQDDTLRSSKSWVAAVAGARPLITQHTLLLLLKKDAAKAPPPLIEAVAAMKLEPGDLNILISSISSLPASALAGAIQPLASGLKRAGTSIEKVDHEHKLAAVFTKAAASAADAKATESTRLESIELLGLTSSKEASDALIQCLTKGQPDAVQAAAVRTLAQSGAAAVTKTLITGWAGYGPTAKEAALTALLAREDRALALLESNVVMPTEFSASQVQALLKHKSPKVAAAAKTALASVIPPSREEVTAKFQPAITAKGDATKGQAQYMARCMACHRAGTMGMQVGPDLITVKTKGREALLTAILDPHKEVASQFIAYTVNTKDGQTLAGIITNDTASSMTLKMMGGVEKTLQRAEIKGSTSTGQSLMPEGIETGMSVSDMADLLSFIEGQ